MLSYKNLLRMSGLGWRRSGGPCFLALLSVVIAIGSADLRKEVGLLRAGPWVMPEPPARPHHQAMWPEGAWAPNGAVMCLII